MSVQLADRPGTVVPQRGQVLMEVRHRPILYQAQQAVPGEQLGIAARDDRVLLALHRDDEHVGGQHQLAQTPVGERVAPGTMTSTSRVPCRSWTGTGAPRCASSRASIARL